MRGNKKVFLSINSSIATKVRIRYGILIDAKGKCAITINIKESSKQIHDVFCVPD